MTLNNEKNLKKNVIDDIVYTKSQIRMAYAGLIIGLWVVFFSFVIFLFLQTRGYVLS